MAQLLIGGTSSGAELDALADALRAAIPDCELAKDQWRVLEKTESPIARSAYDPKELHEREQQEARYLTRSGTWIDAIVALVLPALSGAMVQATVDLAVDWLRRSREKPLGEQAVLIYGPNGEPLRKVRRRRGAAEPEVFRPPWPLPPRREDVDVP
jgi:hypothetical protein